MTRRRYVGFLERLDRAIWHEDDPLLELYLKGATLLCMLAVVCWISWEALR